MKVISLIVLSILFCGAAHAQCTTQPGYVCISQAAANQAAANVRELEATKEKVVTLTAAVADRDKSINENKLTAAANEADLKGALHNTEVQLAEKTGEIVKCESFAVRDSALIEFLVKNQRSKQNGVFNVKLGGN